MPIGPGPAGPSREHPRHAARLDGCHLGGTVRMPKMPVMEAVVKILESEGVDCVFGIPGAAVLPFYAALRKSTRIRHLTVRHEEGGTHAADGWARATGRVGVAVGTSGPAGTNMVTGLYTAMADSIPILTITGQAVKAKLHQEAFQAINIVDIVRPVTKKAYLCLETAQIPWVFREAFQIARSGRPGPVHVDLPVDVARGEVEYDPQVDAPLPVFKPGPNPKAIARATEMLLAAKKPILIMGGGVVLADACAEFVALAEHLQIPVVPTYMAMGGIPVDHPLYAGLVGIQTTTRSGNRIFLESDLVLSIGNRFGDRHTGDLAVYRGARQFIHVDIEPTQLGKVIPPDLGIVSDAKLALEALLAEAKRATAPRAPSLWAARVPALREELARYDAFDTVPIKPPRVFREMNRFFGRDAVFVTAIGLYQIWSGQFQQVFEPKHYFCCGQAGPLGWEVSAATGVKLARADELVVAVVGDYSFQFMMEEVAVAVQYRVPFVIVMLNNGYLGLIRQPEKYIYDMNFGVDLVTGGPWESGVDHVKVMEGMGALGRRVTEPGEIRDALAWAVKASNERRVPALVEVMVEREADAAMGPALDKITEYM